MVRLFFKILLLIIVPRNSERPINTLPDSYATRMHKSIRIVIKGEIHFRSHDHPKIKRLDKIVMHKALNMHCMR